MYGKLLITWFFWNLAIFGKLFCCPLINIFLTQFWTDNLLIHKPQPRRMHSITICQTTKSHQELSTNEWELKLLRTFFKQANTSFWAQYSLLRGLVTQCHLQDWSRLFWSRLLKTSALSPEAASLFKSRPSLHHSPSLLTSPVQLTPT